MKAMILAAGRGERMRPLTNTLPKPMLIVAGKPLILHHIERLKKAGFSELVINISWLGNKIIEFLGDGSAFGVSIQYSNENDKALETAGGIYQALSLLDDNNAPFLVVNGDTYIDTNFDGIPELPSHIQAHIWLVKNPNHNLSGDFNLTRGLVKNDGDISTRYTFSGVGLYRASLFSSCNTGQPVRLAPLLRQAIDEQAVTGSLLSGHWVDVGTPQRLSALNKELEG
ncbi:N-acetylmuramate alpha-1-phosphate uridylyltransferase MurU [Thalassotalea sediminis]|uniref:N-acetylmuramate alpha-1-phosphate uridylyltransferase MurU n=1 Tax=Thalassotalea sediminis TaxID=1759089 RepID=UPI002573DDE5|nr:nucleotidyltransferase family protein [Thalassotalea sediminis]